MSAWQTRNSLYNDPTSGLSLKLIHIKNLIKSFLKESDRDIIVVSLASGQGRDILESVYELQSDKKISIYLIDSDQESLDYAANFCIEKSISNVTLVLGDASLSDLFKKYEIPRADLILMCGIFGRMSLLDIESIIKSSKQLINDGGNIIWTVNNKIYGIFDIINNTFVKNGFLNMEKSLSNDLNFSVSRNQLESPIESLLENAKFFERIDFS